MGDGLLEESRLAEEGDMASIGNYDELSMGYASLQLLWFASFSQPIRLARQDEGRGLNVMKAVTHVVIEVGFDVVEETRLTDLVEFLADEALVVVVVVFELG